MNTSLQASFPSYLLPRAKATAPVPAQRPLSSITPMVKITALLSCTTISGAPVVITSPGRYRLSRDLAVHSGSVITIQSDNVTLDLAGFTISSSAKPSSGAAIAIVGPRRNVTIRNGFIRSVPTPGGVGRGGFLFGVSGGNPSAQNISVRDLDVSGMAVSGIALSAASPTSVVERCRVNDCGDVEIVASQIVDCT